MLCKIKITKENLLKIANIFLIAFLIIQPIFDLKILYNSISTLIRVIIVGILFLFYFIVDSNKKKYLMLIYLFCLAIYIVFHHINALNFKSLVPGNFNYSLIKELLYFVKMLTPFCLIYVLYHSNLDQKKVLMIIKVLVIIISLTIIISNLFVFSYSSYNDQIIKANFFAWFNNSNNYTYLELSSKGLFEYANQISAILLMFLPFSLISFIDKKSIINFITIIINVFALFLLSTKVAVFGVFIVFAYTIIVYFIKKKILKKEKLTFKVPAIFLILLLLYGVILPINPSFMRMDETKAIVASSDAVTENNIENVESTTIVNSSTAETSIDNSVTLTDTAYIEQNYEEKEIKKEFITQSYPYQYDTEFWLNILNEPRYNRVNYRFIEFSMVKRIIQINNNKLDILFGITNSRLQNIFNIERDFVVQYYALGIIGVFIVFVPYFAIIIFYLYKIFKSKFKSITALNLIAFITIIMTFGISYYSGNLLNSLSFTIYFVLLFNLLFETKSQN